MRPTLSRRTLVLAALGALSAAPVLGYLGHRDSGGRDAYEAMVEALLDHGALPDPARGAASAGARLSDLYADALPARRREIDEVLGELSRSGIARMNTRERVAVLRGWAAAGGERRALAARATALAAAAYGPAGGALPVVI